VSKFNGDRDGLNYSKFKGSIDLYDSFSAFLSYSSLGEIFGEIKDFFTYFFAGIVSSSSMFVMRFG
jgi:hypothetical protein